jgi:homoserine kinase type II
MSESADAVRANTDVRIPQIIQHYDLGEVRGAWRPGRGFVNDNWVVRTDQGTVFLKHRHPNLSRPDFIRGQHDLVAWLRQAGFPAPRLLPHAGGETLLMLGSECYEVQDYIEGRPYDHGRTEDLVEAAVTLGHYHTVVEGFSREAPCKQGDLYEPGIAAQNLSQLVQVWQLDRDTGLEGIISHLQAQTLDLAARFGQHGPLPELVIHGDYYADNLLFDGERIVGVVDYDKSSWQPRVVELAEALIYFASPRPGQLTHLVYPGVLQWEPLQRFLGAYSPVPAVSADEARTLPDYIQCIWLQISLQRLLEKGPRPTWAGEALEELVVLSDWVESNADAVGEACQPTAQAS